MNIHSINFKISAVFVFVLLVFNILFFGFMESQKRLERERLERGFFEIARTVLVSMNSFEERKLISIKNRLKDMGIEIVDRVKADELLSSAKPFFEKKIRHDRGFSAFRTNEGYLLVIKEGAREAFVIDKDSGIDGLRGYFFGYFAFNVILISAYILIFNSLRPLKKLTRAIDRFSEGELCIDCKSDRKDEIAEVANAFDKAARRIKALMDSRILFLRMVIHELKTPITKGRVAVEMVEEGKNRDRIIKSFDRLNSLIDEFSKIERLNSNNYEPIKREIEASKLAKLALELSFEDGVECEVGNDFLIVCDVELMSIALKNLLENGIKYSIDKKVYIEVGDKKVVVKSRGEAIKASVEDIVKPFYRADNRSKSESLGLGLYIVKEVLSRHNLELEYDCKNGFNIFTIDFKKAVA